MHMQDLPIGSQTPTAAERTPDAHDLRNYLDRFVTGNKHSNSVEHRWLAHYANDLMMQAYNVKTHNLDTIKEQVGAFRLEEIKKARAALAKQDADLEKEAVKLTVGAIK